MYGITPVKCLCLDIYPLPLTIHRHSITPKTLWKKLKSCWKKKYYGRGKQTEGIENFWLPLLANLLTIFLERAFSTYLSPPNYVTNCLANRIWWLTYMHCRDYWLDYWQDWLGLFDASVHDNFFSYKLARQQNLMIKLSSCEPATNNLHQYF